MLGFSKKTIDPLQPRTTGAASDGMPIRRPDERGREGGSAEEILARLEGHATAARGERRPVGTDPTAGTNAIETSQPPWPADTLLPKPARRGQRPRAHAPAPAIAIDSLGASTPATASRAAHPQPVQQARHRPRLAPQTAPLALAALSCILAILAFERLDNVIAAALSAALTLLGVIASYDAYQRRGGALLIAATDP